MGTMKKNELEAARVAHEELTRLGFVACVWWHPVHEIQIEQENNREPMFTLTGDRERESIRTADLATRLAARLRPPEPAAGEG